MPPPPPHKTAPPVQSTAEDRIIGAGLSQEGFVEMPTHNETCAANCTILVYSDGYRLEADDNFEGNYREKIGGLQGQDIEVFHGKNNYDYYHIPGTLLVKKIEIHGPPMQSRASGFTEIFFPKNYNNNSQDWVNKGVDLTDLGKYDEAIKAFDKAIELDPKNANAWQEKGWALHGLGRYNDAIKALDKAIELDQLDKPSSSVAWHIKGIVLEKLGRTAEANAAYAKAKELGLVMHPWTSTSAGPESSGSITNPQDADAWVNKGLTLEDQRKYDEAVTAYDKAIELDPGNVEAWFRKGFTLRLQGKYDEAIKAFDKAIELNPRYEVAWYNKGYTLELLGRTAEANAVYAKAKELGLILPSQSVSSQGQAVPSQGVPSQYLQYQTLQGVSSQYAPSQGESSGLGVPWTRPI
jgi:tetratricopeptide (TPR) repeat protein